MYKIISISIVVLSLMVAYIAGTLIAFRLGVDTALVFVSPEPTSQVADGSGVQGFNRTMDGRALQPTITGNQIQPASGDW